MKSAIVYYSYTGTTRSFAAKIARDQNADAFEVDEIKRRSRMNALFSGCPAAMRQKSTELTKPLPDLSEYDKIIVAAPIWAGYPAPAFNAVIEQLPAAHVKKDAVVEIVLVSGSGDAKGCHKKVRTKAELLGLNIKDVTDIAYNANDNEVVERAD